MMQFTIALGIRAATIRLPLRRQWAWHSQIGTATGDDGAGNQIGMAPGAKWIGCRNMDQGNGTPARYLECMEFFLAPYPIGGNEGDPLRAPDVTNNSWLPTIGRLFG